VKERDREGEVKGRRHETDGGGAGNEMVKPTDRGGEGSVVKSNESLFFQFNLVRSVVHEFTLGLNKERGAQQRDR